MAGGAACMPRVQPGGLRSQPDAALREQRVRLHGLPHPGLHLLRHCLPERPRLRAGARPYSNSKCACLTPAETMSTYMRHAKAHTDTCVGLPASPAPADATITAHWHAPPEWEYGSSGQETCIRLSHPGPFLLHDHLLERLRLHTAAPLIIVSC